MRTIHIIAFILLIIGGLNWGLIGIIHYNVIAKIFGTGVLANIIYILVGLAALWELFRHPRHCKYCSVDKAKQATM